MNKIIVFLVFSLFSLLSFADAPAPIMIFNQTLHDQGPQIVINDLTIDTGSSGSLTAKQVMRDCTYLQNNLYQCAVRGFIDDEQMYLGFMYYDTKLGLLTAEGQVQYKEYTFTLNNIAPGPVYLVQTKT